MLKPLVAIGFFFSEVILLTVFLGIGIMVSTAATSDAGVGVLLSCSAGEIRTALGAPVVFMMLSGYVVSVAILLALFRARPLSISHAVWVTLLFVLHAVFFIFYLRGPAPVSAAMFIAVEVACVIAAAAAQYLLWNRWLIPRGNISTSMRM